MGADLDPASTFLYSGPAINVLTIVLTPRILGLEMGIARAIWAITFRVVIGLLMYLFFRNEEIEGHANAQSILHSTDGWPLLKTALYFVSIIAFWYSTIGESRRILRAREASFIR